MRTILHFPFSIFNSEHGVAEIPVQSIQQRCLQQEGLDWLCLLLQNFFNQVVEQIAIAAAHGHAARRTIEFLLPSEPGKMQPSDPALRASAYGADVAGSQI